MKKNPKSFIFILLGLLLILILFVYIKFYIINSLLNKQNELFSTNNYYMKYSISNGNSQKIPHELYVQNNNYYIITDSYKIIWISNQINTTNYFISDKNKTITISSVDNNSSTNLFENPFNFYSTLSTFEKFKFIISCSLNKEEKNQKNCYHLAFDNKEFWIETNKNIFSIFLNIDILIHGTNKGVDF